MCIRDSSAGDLVHDISIGWLGAIGGFLAILGVVAAPITTGDTALRSARLIVADMFHIDQRPLFRRVLVSLPLFAVAFGLMLIDFNVLWRYFAWTNQTLAAITLWACTVYLARHGKAYIICLIPAVFMTVIVLTYILYAPAPEGFGLPIVAAAAAGCSVALVGVALFARYRHALASGMLSETVD